MPLMKMNVKDLIIDYYESKLKFVNKTKPKLKDQD